MVIETDQGPMMGKPGDWLITGIAEEAYFVTDDVFVVNYEPVDAAAEEYLKEAMQLHKMGF